MINRVVDLSDRPARLSVQNSLLLVRFPAEAPAKRADGDSGGEERKSYRCERLENPNELTIPLSDMAVLIVSHPQVSFSHAVVSGLASAGAVFVTCNEKHMPVAMLLPLVTHSLQTERFAAQARVSLPARKRMWQQIVRSKIREQGRLLEERTGSDHGLGGLATRVRSGDSGNVEAYAARIYWQKLFDGMGFRRDPDGEGLNACLNYGYAVLRAAVTRALCGSGLHPSLGVHHHNRYDTFCLSDDLMEPFRPIVDRAVAQLADARGTEISLDKDAKRALLESLLSRFAAAGETRTLFDWASRSAASLAAAIEGKAEGLEIPSLEIENPAV